MMLNDLLAAYEIERHHGPDSLNDVLDFYQKKYISGEIDIISYRNIYYYLNKEGAESAHE
ncbi:YppF family protein [Lentibacillus sediminis]|uniref:YppF family protein n=1 Tax=Lentibacillus sediminis TaxID=1940529 RepID=UPI000C1C02B8|nr:YppF family protein [Lentibacillus sediminis]